MDAPEVVSGPVKSLSHIFRRQQQESLQRLRTPPPPAVVHHPGLNQNHQFYPARERRASMYEFYLTKTKEEVENPPPTIWGLRRQTFIVVVAVAVVVLVAAIAGGVGGSMAAANARRYVLYHCRHSFPFWPRDADEEQANQPTGDRAAAASDSTGPMATTTIMTTPTSRGGPGLGPTPTAGAGAGVGAGQDSNSQEEGAATAAAAASITVPTRGIIDFDCGRVSMNRQVVTLGTTSWGFDVNCMMDYAGGAGVDITGVTAYAFDDCVRACALFNKYARNNTCLGVHFSANLTAMLPRRHANCFLKAYLPTMSPVMELGAAASLAYSPQF